MKKKIISLSKDMVSHTILSKRERGLVNVFKKINQDKKPQSGTNKLNILVQMPEDFYFYSLFSLLVKGLSRETNLSVNLVNVACEFQRKNKFSVLKRNKLYERKWEKLYRNSTDGDVTFRNAFYDKTKLNQACHLAEKLLANISTTDELVELAYDTLLIGDLVYDTYLRFKPSVTVDLKDPFLARVLASGILIQTEAEALFKKHSYKYLFTSYCSYIHHGILVRVALKNSIKVFSFGYYDKIINPVLSDYPSHLKRYFEYPQEFQKLSSEVKYTALKIAKENLLKRFSGGKENSTFYMQKAAFDKISEPEAKIFKDTGRKRAVIFLHCFFDSPHCYRSMLFADFYEWINETLEVASEGPFDFYVKPHPNGLEGNDEVVEDLKKKFPKIHFIPKEVNNNQLIAEHFDAAFTVYGTLGHEYPFVNIPVVNAGDNPHIAYKFCVHPETKDEYRYWVKNIDQIPQITAQNRQEICEFYYMHNLHKFPGSLENDDVKFLIDELRGLNVLAKQDEFLSKAKDSAYTEKLVTTVMKAASQVLSY